MKKKIVLSRKSKQTSSPWFKTKKGLKVKLTYRTTTTITCDENDLKDLNKKEIKELKKYLGET